MKIIFAIAKVVLKELLRRKDAYVLLIITALLTLMSGSTPFFGDMKMVRYMKELCLLLVWISSIVIAVTLAARQIYAERESRTLFSLLAKLMSRNQLIFGKFLGCWPACGAALFIFYTFFVVTAVSRGEHFLAGGKFPGLLAALGHARRCCWGDGSGRFAAVRRAVVQRHDFFCDHPDNSHARAASGKNSPCR